MNVVQAWALAGPLKEIQRLILKTLQYCLGCMLQNLVMAQSEFMCTRAGFLLGSLYIQLHSSFPHF